MPSFQKILVPVDFTEASERALDHGIELAKQFGSSLTLVHVYSLPVYNFPDGSFIPTAEVIASLASAAQQQLDAWVSKRRASGVEIRGELRSGSPAEEICKLANEVGADLIVIGTHGRGLLGRALLGSVAQNVIRHATQPVLTVRGPQD